MEIVKGGVKTSSKADGDSHRVKGVIIVIGVQTTTDGVKTRTQDGDK